MSVKYVPVQWNRNKWLYDGVLVAFVLIYVSAFLNLGAPDADVTRPINAAILNMRAFGTCAFFMLTFILCIGPLARLDSRFLPVLYNRRHFGVLTTAVATTHASYVMGWYFAFSPFDPYEALLFSNTAFGHFLGFPIEALGIFALSILLILAATSHDFWLSFLGAPAWKSLHLMIYPAYAAVVGHAALGYLQDARDPVFGILFCLSGASVAGLHALAWWKSRVDVKKEDWLDVGSPGEIQENRARIIHLGPDERVAIFRYDTNHFSAVSNACAHQNGPLGEGRIIAGCITCPWHGFQYRMRDGCSPAPYTEKIPTYNLKFEGNRLLLDRKANEPGTPVEPVVVPGLEPDAQPAMQRLEVAE